jgi:4-oxalmesaconate hydratase
MIIDCHGHYTTAPQELQVWRDRQLAGMADGNRKLTSAAPDISDEQLKNTVEGKQLKMLLDRGGDCTIFSPQASGMAHHVGTPEISEAWSTVCNDLIYRITQIFPKNFIGGCQLPQSPGVSPANCVKELERCVNELDFVVANLNPDPSGGYWQDPPLTDKFWYPIYETLEGLDVPAMIHVSSSCNPCFHATGAHYIAADTTAFMQLIEGDLFKDFPKLKFIIPHGGGAVPYHWGRYRGLAQQMKKPLLKDHVMNNVFFDTCVYHQPGIDLLTKVIPVDNILFASEMIGAVQGIDPETGNYYDDTKRYIDACTLPDADKKKVFETNARKVFGRLDSVFKKRGLI